MFLDAAVRRISELAGTTGGTTDPQRTITIDAHDAVARTLGRGLPLAADATGALERLATPRPSAPPAPTPTPTAPGPLAFVRSRPALSTFDALASPAWAHGMAVTETVGPLVDENGIGAWIDTIVPAPKKYAIVRAPGSTAIAYVIAASAKESVAGGTTTVTFGAGTLWLVAPLLDSHAPANAFAGLAFSAASLSVPGVLSAPSPDTFLLPAGTTATFDCAPDAGAPPVAVAGIANDGTAALATLPPDLRLAFAPGATKVTALGNAGLTVYGQTVLLEGGPAGAAYDAAALELAFRYAAAPSPAQIAISAPASPTFVLGGTAPLKAAAYRIPVALTTPDALAAAAGGGALGLDCGPGFTAAWGALEAPGVVDAALLHVATGVLGVAVHTAARAFADTYELWEAHNGAGASVPAALTLAGPRGTVVIALEGGGGEAVIATGCTVSANIDRPLLASGAPPSLVALRALYALVRTPANLTILVEAAVPPSLSPGPSPVRPAESYVLENAVLRTRGTTALLAYGVLGAPRRATAGMLALSSALDLVEPILPDPYAANLDVKVETVAESLVGVVSWTVPPAPQLAFAILRPASSAASADVAVLAREAGTALAELYDVVGAQAQFGVAVTLAALQGAQILDRRLAVSGMLSGLFTVPSIAWEPVIDVQRNWYVKTFTADDGPPALVNVPTAALRPLEPAAFLDLFLADFAAGADLWAQLTLPFGLTATVDTNADRNTSPKVARPTLVHAEPSFALGNGGRQLSIRAAAQPGGPVLPGSSRAGDAQYVPPSANADSAYVHQILDDSPNHLIASFWNADFGGDATPGGPSQHFVPVTRYDLSGYGASIFSDYDYSGPLVGIDQARFDVIVGRTLFELVEAQSYILPWFIPVVNTTIFSRDSTGYVQRWNSGWRAKAAGTFAYPGAVKAETGGVVGVFDVRNIAETPGLVSANGKNFVRVTFDADVHLVVDPAQHGLKVTGGDPAGKIPSSGLTGYLDATALDLPTIADAVALCDLHGPGAGPLAANVDVDATGVAMGLSGVEAAGTRSDVAPRTIAVALRGTPRLPHDGAWSVATRSHLSTTPSSLPPGSAVPLVRAAASSDTWHLADAADVTKLTDPLTAYGLLQATGANKVFFEQPTIKKLPAALPLNFQQTPKLADVGALLGASGILPDILSLLDFGAFDGLAPSGDGFALKKTLQQDVAIDNRVLLALGPIRLLMSSWPAPSAAQPKPTHIALDLDPTASPHWKIAIQNLAFKLAIDGWGGDDNPVVTVHGDASAQDGSAPTLSNLAVQYGDTLDEVKQVLTEIEQVASFLPGGSGSGLDVSFAGSKLRIREAFPIPQIPLGLGYIEDIALDLGFDIDVLAKSLSFFVSVGSEQSPFHWLVSPLSGNGLLAFGATDKMGIEMQAGIGLGLALDFAIVSGSASIVIAVRFDATSSPIGVMVLLTGQASVDVLDGLASASLTLTAGLGVKVQPGPAALLLPPTPDPIEFLKETVVTLSAEVAVGIHISICWVVHIDFDGSWPFSETISGKTLAALV